MRSLILALAIAAGHGCAVDNPAGPMLWQVEGSGNTVYLLGSVHLLRAEDYPLPEAYELAYVDAERLVMELDLDDLDATEIQQTMLDAGATGDGGDLRALLGEEVWASASAKAAAIGIELDNLKFVEPWLAALTIVDMQMIRLGYDPRYGIELHYAGRASGDAKTVTGLESVGEQIAFFDELPLPTQRRFLLKAIEDAQDLQPGMNRLIAAWKNGDLAALEREMLAGFEGFPELYESLVVTRNRRWAHALKGLLDDEPDYLVIVGALHLIGDDSVIALLRNSGHAVERY